MGLIGSGKGRSHRDYFFAAYGFGPFDCYFCHDHVAFNDVVVHHLNGDKKCNHPYNLVPAHNQCHVRFHRHAQHPAAADVVAAYEEGLSITQVARRFGVSRSLINRRLKDAGIVMRPPRLPAPATLGGN